MPEHKAAPLRRIVTGHDKAGRAVLLSDAAPTRVQVLGAHGPTFYEIWNTRETPVQIDRSSAEPHEAQLALAPPRNGTHPGARHSAGNRGDDQD